MTEVTGMRIGRAERGDLQEILALQYLAYQGEAVLCGNPRIPPLTQTIEDVEREFEGGVFLKALDEEGSIVGSVRGRSEDGTLHIGKIIVRPDLQGRGRASYTYLTRPTTCAAEMSRGA